MRFHRASGLWMPSPPNFAGWRKFTPLSVAGLKHWFDASTLGVADGTVLNTYTDLSGNGWDLTAFGATGPAYRANASTTGKKGVQFSGANSLMSNTTKPLTTVTSFVVLLGNGASSAAHPISLSDSVNHGFNLSAGNSINHNLVQNTRSGVTAACTAAYNNWAWTGGSTYLISRQEHGPTVLTTKWFLNRVQVTASLTQTGADPGSASVNVKLCLGGLVNSPPTTLWPGWMAEALVYSPMLSAADATAVEAYLAAKWQ